MIGLANPGVCDMRMLTAPEIADDLRERIKAGEYQPGDRLEFSALADLYSVKRPAIKRAVALLRALRLVEDQPGRGVYVADPLPPGMLDS